MENKTKTSASACTCGNCRHIVKDGNPVLQKNGWICLGLLEVGGFAVSGVDPSETCDYFAEKSGAKVIKLTPVVERINGIRIERAA